MGSDETQPATSTTHEICKILHMPVIGYCASISANFACEVPSNIIALPSASTM